jgi:hypothetical protein
MEMPQYTGQHGDAKPVTTSDAINVSSRSMQVAVLGNGDKDKVVRKPVQTGRDLGDNVEVRAGLAPLDRDSFIADQGTLNC